MAAQGRRLVGGVFLAALVVVAIVAAGLGFLAGRSGFPGEALTRIVTSTVTSTVTITATTPSPQPALAQLEDAARREGRLVIYSPLDRPSAQPLLDAFKARYPFIDVQYVELGTVALYNRYVSERAAGAGTADILWSAAPDLQYLLLVNGSAQPYRVSSYDSIPEDAKYKDLAYITSFIVAAPAYNPQKFPRGFPTTYQGLLKMLTDNKSAMPQRSIVAFDIERSAFALVFTYYYYKAAPDLFANIFKAAGSIGVVLQPATGPQIEGIKTGQFYLSLGLVANFAYREARTDPRVDAVLPSDYVVLVPWVMFITKEARNPNAAKLFIEYVLSAEGQSKLAEAAEVTAITDNPVFPHQSLGYIKNHTDRVLIVKMGDPWLSELLDPNARRNFIAMWKGWLGLG